MGFNPNKTAAPAQDSSASLAVAGDGELPTIVAPTTEEYKVLIKDLVMQSDKDLRIMFSGIYQAVLQSAPIFTTGLIKDLDHWHQVIEAEVDHYIRRVLDRSKVG